MKYPLIRSLLFLGLYFGLTFTIGTLPVQTYINLGFASNLNQAIAIHSWSFIIMHLIWITCGTLLFKSRFQYSLKEYKKHFIRFLLYAIIGLGALIIIDSLFNFQTANQNGIVTMLNSLTSFQKIIFIIIVTIIGPINEELVFRQILIGEFSTYLPSWFLLLFSSFLFGLLHIPSFNVFYQILPYFGSGLVLGIVYLTSKKNILCSTSVHWLNNILSLFL